MSWIVVLAGLALWARRSGKRHWGKRSAYKPKGHAD